jgi:hypothetical protein
MPRTPNPGDPAGEYINPAVVAAVAAAPARTRSQIGRSSAERGKAGERAVVAYLRVSGFPGAERTVRTGYSVASRTSRDRGDIDGTPGIVWQVKITAEVKWHLVPQWLADTDDQRRAAEADIGILVIRRKGHSHPSSWWAHLHLHQLVRLTGGTDHETDRRVPVRLELQHVIPLLRRAGYGSPVERP